MLLEIVFFVVIFLVFLKIFAIMTTGVNKSHTCLVGKTVLITGGDRGIGYETALGLAARGCRLIIADKIDCEETKNRIIEETNNTNIVTKRFDLASFSSIRRLAEDLKNTEERLDVLINNAGVGGDNEETLTVDKNVKVMQINHLGPFLLTHLLIDLIKKSDSGRIIFVSSFLAFRNNLTVENMNKYQQSAEITYGNSKLCTIITAKILARHLKGSNITVNSLHPGMVKNTAITPCIPTFILPFYGKSVEEGAQTSLHLTLSKQCKKVTGKFFADCTVFWEPPRAYNEEFCKKIFEESEKLAGLQPHEKIANF